MWKKNGVIILKEKLSITEKRREEGRRKFENFKIREFENVLKGRDRAEMQFHKVLMALL